MERPTLGTVQRMVWEGRLPLEIVLAPSESRTFDQTEPYLVIIASPESSLPQTVAHAFTGLLSTSIVFTNTSSEAARIFLTITH